MPDSALIDAASPAREDAADATGARWTALMASAQDGDGAAYRALLTEIVPYLRALARRQHRLPADVEDAVQDVLLAVHGARHAYDPARPFVPWLQAVARHRLTDRLRRHGRTAARETALAPEHEAFADPHGAGQEAAVDAGRLRGAVARLPAGQRQAIELLKLDGLSLAEASARSGISVAALKVATHRALRSLRTMLGT